MSTYASLEGAIRYPDTETLEQVLDMLQEGAWVDENYEWVDENNNRILEPGTKTFDKLTNTLRIPNHFYYNLTYKEDELLDPATDGIIIGVKHSEGWIRTPRTDNMMDLEAWGKAIGNPPPDREQDEQAYLDWEHKITTTWFARHNDYTL